MVLKMSFEKKDGDLRFEKVEVHGLHIDSIVRVMTEFQKERPNAVITTICIRKNQFLFDWKDLDQVQ